MQELEHLPLAVGQLDTPLAHEWQPTALAARSELLDQSRDETTGERRLALEHPAQRERQATRVGVLQQIARRARAQCCEQIVVVARDGQHDDGGGGQRVDDLLGCLDAAAGHVHVEQRNVRLRLQCGSDRFWAVGGFGDHDEPFAGERQPDARAYGSVVVRQQDGNPLLGHGTTTSTWVPWPGRDLTSTLAPRASARSRMLVSPNPRRRGACGSKPLPSSLTNTRIPLVFDRATMTLSASPWRAAFDTASRTMRARSSRTSGATRIPGARSKRMCAPVRAATSSAACASAASSGSSTLRLSAAIAVRDSSSARSAAAAMLANGPSSPELSTSERV